MSNSFKKFSTYINHETVTSTDTVYPPIIQPNKEREAMSDEDYKNLESLLGKLGNEVGSNRICIITGILQEGYQLATYDGSGDLLFSASSYDVKSCVVKIKKQQPLT